MKLTILFVSLIFFLGFSTDGASSFLKAMNELSDLNGELSDEELNEIPQEFKYFFFALFKLKDISLINDPTHLAVKMFWRLMRLSPLIGTQRASKAIIIEVLETFGKLITGVSVNTLTDLKDAMNFDRVSQICNEHIISFFTAPDQFATKCYLKMIMYVIKAYIDPETSPEQRIEKAWYVIFFCRFWKLSNTLRGEVTNKNDFLSANAYNCIELNGHNLLKFLIACREMNQPELFLLYSCHSQDCESFFRTFRALGTTSYTSINFRLYELLHKVRRVTTMTHIREVEENYDFERKERIKAKPKTVRFVPENLPSNLKIAEIIAKSLDEARTDLKKLGNYWVINIFLINS